MDLSIIIVHYKTPDLLRKCLYSIYAQKCNLSFEVIVIDNNSQDDSQIIAEEFKKIKWINCAYNSGFSRANNIGIKKSKGNYVLVLNPDSHIKGAFLEKFYTFYKDKDKNGKLGLLGCRIISTQNENLLIGSGVGFPSLIKHIKANPIYIYLTRRFTTSKKKYKPYEMHYQNHVIDFVSGACVMIKKDKILKPNLLFDEDFFLYYEDVEWSFRIQKQGYYNYFYSEIEVYHYNSASTEKSEFKDSQIQISELLYFFKTMSRLNFYILIKIIKLNYTIEMGLLKNEMLKSLIKRKNIFQRYSNMIPLKYNKISSSAKKYLNYVEEN